MVGGDDDSAQNTGFRDLDYSVSIEIEVYIHVTLDEFG